MSRTPRKGGSTPLHVGDAPYVLLDMPAIEILSRYKANVLKVYCIMYAKCFSDKRSLYAQQKTIGGNYDLSNQTICTFSQRDMRHYGIDHNTAKDCIQVLTEIGAVRVIENNRHRKRMNVYQLMRWDKWKEKPP